MARPIHQDGPIASFPDDLANVQRGNLEECDRRAELDELSGSLGLRDRRGSLRELIAEPVIGALLCGSMLESADEDEVKDESSGESGQQDHRRCSDVSERVRGSVRGIALEKGFIELTAGRVRLSRWRVRQLFDIRAGRTQRRFGDGHEDYVEASRRRRASKMTTRPT